MVSSLIPREWTENRTGSCVFQYTGYKNNQYCTILHSFNDKPASTERNQDFGTTIERWFNHGKRHRLNGPAITCVRYGKLEWYQYWIDGAEITEKEFKGIYLITFLEEYKPPQGI